MSKHPCPHGAVLPRGLYCDRGYLTVRLKTPQGPYFRSCRAHTKEAERTATLLLNKVREKLALGAFELPTKLESWTFTQVAKLYYQRHYEEWRDPSTREGRSESSKRSARAVMGTLDDFFGKYRFDAIEAIHVEAYRDRRLDFDGVSGSTFNREKSVLSSMFSMVEKWCELKKIDPIIRCPKKNPCLFVEDMKESSRERVASMEEIKRLKEACIALNDPEMWSIIKMELETTLRLGDLKRVKDAKHTDGTMTLTQGKTGVDIHLPSIKSGQSFSNFRKRWEQVRKQAVLCDLQFRDLRRTGAHMLKTLGYTADLIKDTLGHADVRTTQRYLNYKDTSALRPLIESRRKLLESI